MRWDIQRPCRKLCARTASSCELLSTNRDRVMFGAMMRISFGQDKIHFRHRDHRQITNEEKKQRSENAERADKRPDVDPRRNKQSPRGRQKVAVQSADDDDETL